VALGVAAGLEIPALLAIGRLSRRISDIPLIASGCIAGAAYYAAMATISSPMLLIAAQVLNAWFFAVVAGTGLTLFQRIIPRAGLAAGLYTNTRRLGAIASGPLIGIGALTTLGYRGVFIACAALTILALGALRVVARSPRSPHGLLASRVRARHSG
jgi:SET family sugar efflux transporter-like MFS transporter